MICWHVGGFRAPDVVEGVSRLLDEMRDRSEPIRGLRPTPDDVNRGAGGRRRTIPSSQRAVPCTPARQIGRRAIVGEARENVGPRDAGREGSKVGKEALARRDSAECQAGQCRAGKAQSAQFSVDGLNHTRWKSHGVPVFAAERLRMSCGAAARSTSPGWHRPVVRGRHQATAVSCQLHAPVRRHSIPRSAVPGAPGAAT